MARALAPALLLAVLAGCIAAPTEPACAVEDPWADGPRQHTLSPNLERDWYLGQSDPRQPFDYLTVLWDAPTGSTFTAGLETDPAWATQTTVHEGIGQNGTPGALVHHRFEPTGGSYKALDRTEITWPDAEGCAGGVELRWLGLFEKPQEGEQAQAGQGAHVLTAGFWENGTLFFTNMVTVDQAPLPRAGWYEWGGAEPLPVYVYDQDSSERPALWNPTGGTPLQGIAPLPAYSTTIPGFNEALKGLSTTTTRVVHVAPEDAYTRPGYEDHPLYGDAVVFLIKLVEVSDAPCPDTGLGLCDLPV